MNAYDSPEDKIITELKDRIAELERLVSDMIYEKSSGVYDRPQTKPLSDADIEQISHCYHYTYNPDYIGFARAIEERHGIK